MDEKEIEIVEEHDDLVLCRDCGLPISFIDDDDYSYCKCMDELLFDNEKE